MGVDKEGWRIRSARCRSRTVDLCDLVNLRSAEGSGKVGKVVRRGVAQRGAAYRRNGEGGAEYHGIPAVAEAVARGARFASRAKMAADFGQDPDGRCVASCHAAPRRAAPRRGKPHRCVGYIYM